MTERMSDQQLDREIRNFLAWQAEDVANAPSAAEMASRISSRAGTRILVPRLAPQLVWVVLALLLIVALMGALVIGAISRPATLPTNGWIAYSTRAHGATSGVPGEIFLVREGAAPRFVVGNSAVCPSFSPGGTKLSYLRDTNVFILGVDPAGGTIEETGFGVAGLVPDACPIWSPSGEAIAVLAAGEIVLHGQDRSLRSLPAPDGAPVTFADTLLAWAPDGTAIALAMDTGIWLVPVDGSPPQKLFPSQAFSLAWSPDGSQLAFYEQVAGPNGRVSVLTLGADAPAVVLGTGSRPAWSPAGDWIAYQGDEGLVIDRIDRADRRVVGVQSAYGFGAWSPDGGWLLQMVDVSGSDWDLISVPATGTTNTPIARGINTGSARNFPNLGDISWQAVYP